MLCLICHAGGNTEVGADAARLRTIQCAIDRDLATPIILRCNVSSHYDFQNPGHEEDTPEGTLYNTKRDLDILQRLGLAPGDTRPAWELIKRIVERIPTVAGVCGYAGANGAWRGCPSTFRGYYEQGIAAGMAVIAPSRAAAEMATVKTSSAQCVQEASMLEIRPHHLLCMACFHGGQGNLSAINEDNLYEAICAVQRNPEIPVTLVQGPCMICPPCPHLDPATNRCVRNNAMALRDEKKDLDLLQRLGLEYGATLPARELFTRLFNTIAATTEICGCGDGIERGWEWSICGGADGNPAYPKARAAGLGIPGLVME